MLKYEVDEDNKVIKCVISGDEVVNYVNKVLTNVARDYRKSIVKFDKVEISKSYTGIANYHATEDKPFDINIGKEIARKKAFRKFNNAVAVKLNEVKQNVAQIQNKLYYQCQKYTIITDDINEVLKTY